MTTLRNFGQNPMPFPPSWHGGPPDPPDEPDEPEEDDDE